nr:aminoacetone oxidase family FAD-binding enzyme [Bacteroidota bacterium]
MDVIVIGGGAAGFFAAINAADFHKNSKVTLLEKSSKLLSKVRVSGGGRCNVTHACYDNAQLIKNYPRGEKELRNAFSRFSTADTVRWFKEHGVELKTETDGRMFPTTDNSATIIQCLMQAAEISGVGIKLNVDITAISKIPDGKFLLNAVGGGIFTCDNVIIATGGNSKDAAYNWLRELGHTIQQPVPSLFTFNIPDNKVTELMGVAVPLAKVKIAGTKLETEGPLLITHWGLSGPAILKASSWGARLLSEKNYTFSALINWLPKHTEEKLRIEFANLKEESASRTLSGNCPFELPKRLWEY